MSSVMTGNGSRTIASNSLDSKPVAFETIPIIDLAPLFGSDLAGRAKLAADLRRACTEIGFFYIKNHQVPQDVIDATFAAAKTYFAKSSDEKMRNHVSLSKNIRGYAALLEENTDPTARGDLHESFDIALEVPLDDPDVLAGKVLYGPNQWPEGDAAFRTTLLRYYDTMLQLSHHLLHAFALALDLEERFFDHAVTKPLAAMRVLHYPPQFGEIDDRQIGIGAHSDYECFTILAQDTTPALQVLNTDGEWISANPIPGCFVVNIGDQMARWTNDLFASTVHRAVNRSGRERFSIPFFMGPNYETVVAALPSCVTADRPAKYPPITTGDYIKGRFTSAFAHYKEQTDSEDAA